MHERIRDGVHNSPSYSLGRPRRLLICIPNQKFVCTSSGASEAGHMPPHSNTTRTPFLCEEPCFAAVSVRHNELRASLIQSSEMTGQTAEVVGVKKVGAVFAKHASRFNDVRWIQVDEVALAYVAESCAKVARL